MKHGFLKCLDINKILALFVTIVLFLLNNNIYKYSYIKIVMYDIFTYKFKKIHIEIFLK